MPPPLSTRVWSKVLGFRVRSLEEGVQDHYHEVEPWRTSKNADIMNTVEVDDFAEEYLSMRPVLIL